MEALAIIRALQFAWELDISEVVLEEDSEIITTALKDEHLPLLYSHIRREGNMVAHNLARYTKNVSDYVVWIKDAPPHIHNVIQADSAFFY